MIFTKTNECGVYCLLNTANGKCYIGSTGRSFFIRFNEHFHDLKNNRHHNPLLQNAWNKYGESNFEFSVLEVVEPAQCKDREQFYMDGIKGEYNLNPLANTTLGRTVSQETRDKLSKANTGKIRGAGQTWNFGKKLSKEHKTNISKSITGSKNPMSGKFGKDCYFSKKAICINKKDNTIHEFDCVKDLAIFLNLSASNVVNILKGRNSGNSLKNRGLEIKYKEVS